MPLKKKTDSKPAAPKPFIVATCQACGMQWKHYGKKKPNALCAGCIQKQGATTNENSREEAETATSTAT